MSKTMINPQAIAPEWGGVLNLTLGATMTTEECLDIVKKLDDISKNKFYTINVYDVKSNKFLGDCELIVNSTSYVLERDDVNTLEGRYLITYRYVLTTSGHYVRILNTKTYAEQSSISDILSRLDAIEQQLGI